MIGLIGKKLGMTQVFTPDGNLVPVTVLQAGPCTVVQRRIRDRDGYDALQLGFGEQKPQRFSKAAAGHRKKAGSQARVLREFRDAGDFEVGHELRAADVFQVGDQIDVTGLRKGRGYAGVIKRHHFAGFPGSHGTHEYFRHAGSIGNRSYPGRVFKGKRMAGRMGAERVTTLALRVVEVRNDENLILVQGAVPGARNGLVIIRKTVRSGRAEGE